MSKLIIKNDSDLPIDEALKLVQRVIKLGRNSNFGKQYCYISVFGIDGKDYYVTSGLNKKSDVFTIYLSKEKII